MTVEMTPFEAEILIGVLTGADGIFPATSPELSEALKELRPWRSALVGAYIRERAAALAGRTLESPEAHDAVDPVLRLQRSPSTREEKSSNSSPIPLPQEGPT